MINLMELKYGLAYAHYALYTCCQSMYLQLFYMDFAVFVALISVLRILKRASCVWFLCVLIYVICLWATEIKFISIHTGTLVVLSVLSTHRYTQWDLDMYLYISFRNFMRLKCVFEPIQHFVFIKLMSLMPFCVSLRNRRHIKLICSISFYISEIFTIR